MKKIILFVTCIFTAFSLKADTGQLLVSADDLKDKDLIYRLVVYKMSVENYVYKNCQSDNKNADDKAKLLQKYVTVKANMDAATLDFVYQLNMKRRYVKRFVSLNSYFDDDFDDNTLEKYKKGLINYFAGCDQLLKMTVRDDNSQPKTGIEEFSISDATSVISTLYSIVQDWIKARADKADKLASLLSSLELAAANDLQKNGPSSIPNPTTSSSSTDSGSGK